MGVFFNPQHTHPGKLGMKSPPGTKGKETFLVIPDSLGYYLMVVVTCDAGMLKLFIIHTLGSSSGSAVTSGTIRYYQ